MDIGRICYKTAGRDSNKVCVVVDVTDKGILVDGNTRRRMVNPAHLEPTRKTLSLKKGASSDEVRSALEKAGFALEVKGKARNKKHDQKSE